MIKWRSIQLKLFVSYSSVVLSIILIFTVIFYSNISRTLNKNAADLMFAQANNISFQTDSMIEEMNLLSTRLLFSEPLIKLFYSDMFENNSDSLSMQRQFNSLVYSITGPQLLSYQINMFHLSGEYAGVGNTSIITHKSRDTIQNIDWLNDCIALDGSKLITKPHNQSFGIVHQPVISICRTFAPYWGAKKDSILEIQIAYSLIEKIVKNNLADASNSQIYIFNQYGDCIFPKDHDGVYDEYFNYVKQSDSKDLLSIKTSTQNEVIASTHSSNTSWTIIVTQSTNSLLAPVYNFRNVVVGVGVGIMLIMLFITYSISRSLAVPIKKIYHSVANLTFDTMPNEKFFQIDANVNELEELNTAFRNMCERLRTSLDETVAAHSMEIQSRLLALQSQMNPHFLYNTLATISILAEKQESVQIIQMCDSLSDMMRYISSGSNKMVTISTDLWHVNRYIELMRVRFADEMIFTIDISDELLNVLIPKLTIQPLVENCAKYATTGVPPWHISVTGNFDDETWFIMVTDNGQGFSQEALAELKSKIDHASEMSNRLELDGMGLINIYMRLFLHYGKETIFEYGNLPEGGAFVRVGGPAVYSKGGCNDQTSI